MSLALADMDKPKGKDRGRLEEGPVHARIVSVVDFGLQEQTDWETKAPKDPKKTVMITFETPSERIEFEDKETKEKISKPRWISKEYPLIKHEKAGIMKLVKAVAPDATSLDELLNKPCLITVGTTSGGKAKVAEVSQPMKGFTVGDLENDTFHFDFDNPDLELFNGLPEWQQDKIKDALNYNGFADDGAGGVSDDDIPF